MNIALPQENVLGPVQFDRGTIFRLEEDLVSVLNGPNVRSDSNNASPRQTLTDGRGGWNQDSTRASTIAFGTIEAHKYAIMQKLDRHSPIRVRSCVRSAHS